jgi:hypothetical protein
MKTLMLHIFILVVATSYGLGESETVAVAKIDCGGGGLVELVRRGDSLEYQVYLEGKPLLETFTRAISVGLDDELDEIDPRALRYQVLHGKDRRIVGISEATNPGIVFIVIDFAKGKSWPAVPYCPGHEKDGIRDPMVSALRLANPKINVRHTVEVSFFELGNPLDQTTGELDPAPKTPKAEQGGAVQPSTRPESKSKGSDKPQPEAEGRSR